MSWACSGPRCPWAPLPLRNSSPSRLGPAAVVQRFGLYAAALVVIKLSVIFEGLGVAPAIVQRPTLEERHLRVGFTLSILLSVAVAGLVWSMAPAIANLLRLADLAPVVRGACVVFLFQGFSMVAQASAQRALRFRWLAGVDAIAFAVGFVVVGPALAWLGFGIWALVGALVTQHFCAWSCCSPASRTRSGPCSSGAQLANCSISEAA